MWHQCPYDPACKCKMVDPCLGCETFNPEVMDVADERDYFKRAFEGRDVEMMKVVRERDELRAMLLRQSSRGENVEGL